MRFQVNKSNGAGDDGDISADESGFQFLNSGSVSLHSYGDAQWLIGSNVRNTNMTAGLTINQGAADDEILAFKSSDVAHAYTAQFPLLVTVVLLILPRVVQV
jgi:hypothetical protein